MRLHSYIKPRLFQHRNILKKVYPTKLEAKVVSCLTGYNVLSKGSKQGTLKRRWNKQPLLFLMILVIILTDANNKQKIAENKTAKLSIK